MMRYVLFALALVGFVACQPGSGRTAQSAPDSLEVESLTAEDTTLVELYVGHLEQAERDTLEVVLRLYASGRYEEERRAGGVTAGERTVGAFQMRSDTLVLEPRDGSAVQRGVLGSGVVRLLDAEGRLLRGQVLRSVDRSVWTTGTLSWD